MIVHAHVAPQRCSVSGTLDPVPASGVGCPHATGLPHTACTTSNVLQAPGPVCAIPATNVEIARKSGGEGTHLPPHAEARHPHGCVPPWEDQRAAHVPHATSTAAPVWMLVSRTRRSLHVFCAAAR